MSQQEVRAETIKLVAASCPGGMARQYRVQVRDTSAAAQWRLVGNFGNAGQACDRAVELTLEGQNARVVACRALPTAA